MSKTNNFREMAKVLRKAGDIVDKLADNLDDESIDKREQEEKQDHLLAELMVQMMKIQHL